MSRIANKAGDPLHPGAATNMPMLKNKDKKNTRYLLILLSIFFLLAAGIIGSGYSYYHNYEVNYRSQAEHQISSIAELKAGELVRWRRERMGDAALFYKNPAFSSLVQRYFVNADDVEAAWQLRTWLGHTLEICPYERIILLDTGYAKKMVVPDGPERPVSPVSQSTSAMLQSGQIAFEDFYYNEVDQRIYLKVMIPILDRDDDSRVIGFLALRIDPEQYLYPMIMRWPTPSTTAETLIGRIEGNNLLILNQLKFQKDTALKLRIPLEKMGLQAAGAAPGQQNIMGGSEYRSAEVIAIARSVPGSPWLLVAQIDASELYAPLAPMLWVMVMLVGALLTGAGVGVGLVWRRQSQLYYRERMEAAEALSKSETQYRLLSEHTTDYVWLMDMNLNITYISPTLQIRGLTSQEIMEMPFEKLVTPESLKLASELFLEEMPRVAADPLYNPVRTLELENYRKDGTTLWTENKFSVIRDESGRPVSILAETRDISERRKVQAAFRESEAKYSAVVNESIDGIIIAQGRYLQYVNPAVLKITGYGEQELMDIPFLELVHPDDRETVGQRYLKRLSGENITPVYEARITCKDGAVKHFEISGTFIQYKDQPADLAILRDITERKKTRDALSESEERYRSLVESALEAIIVIQDGLIRYANPRAHEIMGYTGEQDEPRPFIGFIHADDRAMVIDRHLRRLKGEEFENAYPIRILDNRGDLRWVQISTAVISWQGKPATLTFLADISENKRAERVLEIQRDLGIKLSQTEDLNEALQSCLEAAIEISGLDSGGIYLVDPRTGDLNLVYSIGLSDIFLAGVSYFEASSPLAQLVMAGKPLYLHNDELALPADGIIRSEGLKITAVIPVYRGNRVIACLNIASHSVQNVTLSYRNAIETIASRIGGAADRMQAREALRESEEKYRNLVELLHEGIWAIDEDAHTTYVNIHMAEMLGYTVDEMQGKELFFFMDEESRKIASQNLERRRQGIKDRYDLDFLRKDGVRICTSLSVAPLIGTDGKYRGAIAGVQDITDRKRLEEEQQRVEKLESIGLLAGGIAHDFNNILTAILGNISLAGMEAQPGSEIHKSLEQAEKASLRARDLTQQLLTFSKGGVPVKKLASLTELLRDTAGFALRGSNIKCRFFIPDDLWHAEIDAGQVSQVVHNLVINALQAMPTGGTIELTAENMALSETQSLGRGLPLNEGNYIRIAVTDHGSGIPADHLDKVFDPFFTTKQKGSGLGLATSFSIARHHGGHLSVESELGSGSTFYLYLPASRQTSTPRQDIKEKIKPAGKARILVMDDEKGVREVAGRMLRHIGYEDVEFAADGAAAVSLYKAALESGQSFSVIILDLTVAGGMGGRETITQLLSIDPGVKAIVSSGYTDESVMAEYQGYGFCGMIAKPYSLGELGKAVHDVIG
jgi:PAS domain S-box-containing protein